MGIAIILSIIGKFLSIAQRHSYIIGKKLSIIGRSL